MRNAAFLAMMGMWLGVAHAQPTFEKFYQSGTSYGFDLVELPGSSILTAMGATLLLDSEGEVDHASFFHGGGTYLVQSVKPHTANEFYFTTGIDLGTCPWGGADLVHPVLGIMDSLGSVITLNSYELNNEICRGTPAGLEVTSAGVVTWGRKDNFYVLNVDPALQHVWSKRLFHGGSFQFIKELPGGDLLAGINMDTAGAVLVRMEADGNILWSKSYIRPRGMVHDAVIGSDDSFIITGFTDSTTLNMFTPLPVDFQPKLFMMKVNGEGEVQWCRGYFSSPDLWYTGRPSRIERTLDGNYVVLATLGYPQNNHFHRPFLMKTDTNGESVWMGSAGADGYDYFTQDVLAYSDGGIVFSGIVWGELPEGNSSMKYIFKADSLGQLSCGENALSVQGLDLFPVDSSFTLNYTDGMATASYVSVNDSILDPELVLVYDACLVTQVPAHNLTKQRSIRVYPNPTPGRFTVEFTDPLLAESYYSVYDALGRLLLQRRLPTGATLEQVDLSRFGQGTYVIKITDPEGVRYERVTCAP